MEKKPFQYKQQQLQKKNKVIPHIRYNKDTDEWTSSTSLIKIKEEPTIKINKKQLDSIAKIIGYLYSDEKKKYMESASNSRKEHIYNDLQSIDLWLTIEYNKIKEENEKKR